MVSVLKSDELTQFTKREVALLLVHNGSLDKKINKAIQNDGHGVSIATLNYADDPAALEILHISDAAPTLLAFEDGEEVGRIFRPKAKSVYEYIDYLKGIGPKPEDRTADDKANVASRIVTPTHVTGKNFKSVVLKNKSTPVLVDFWAEWCGPCHAVAPVIEKLANEMDGDAVFAKLNIDEQPALSNKYGVRSIPTMIIYKDGKEVDRLVGAMPEHMIRRRVQEWV
jgi:thioredoxin 1